MKKRNFWEETYRRSSIMDHPVPVLVLAVLSIALGVFFIVMQRENKPIPKEQALAYSGYFDYYYSSKKYCEIHFEDGTYYDVYPYTEAWAFCEKMESIPKGTKLYILVNPNNGFVAEVRTENEELMNFELSQQKIDAYDNGYIGIGVFMCVGGVFLIAYEISTIAYSRKESARRDARRKSGRVNSAVIRNATTQKSRILLEANVKGYMICYRRVKTVNELVINGRVYDEKKGVIEFPHRLEAVVDGHIIAAGCDNDSYSYILFDGKTIERKFRMI